MLISREKGLARSLSDLRQKSREFLGSSIIFDNFPVTWRLASSITCEYVILEVLFLNYVFDLSV